MPNKDAWLLTYGDMVTLLLVFFIVMFASSQIQQEKLLAMSESLKKALHMSAAEAATGTGAALISAPRTADRTTAVTEAIKAAAKALGIDKGVSISADERGTVISLVDTFFFDPGGVTIKPHAQQLLKQAAEFIAATDSTIHVEGHTDDREINKGIIKSNWELSALRATEVVRFFLSHARIAPDRLVAIGYGSTRPLFPNDSAEHRDRNRRVDIVLIQNEPKPKDGRRKSSIDVLSGQTSLREEEKRKTSAGEVSGGIKE